MILPDSESLRDRLIAWSLLPFFTPVRIRLLLESSGFPTAPCKRSSIDFERLLGVTREEAALLADPFRLPPVAREVERLRTSVVALTDDDYPLRLREIPDPPLVLHLEGRRELLAAPSIAVVGSRRASPYAVTAADRIGAALSGAGVTVVSGFARGVDTAAHDAALRHPASTIAVLGTGIESDYPRSNRRLRSRIAAEGLLVTEFPPGTPPRALNFPIRNRVIAGLTLGTIVVEAAGRSGSLITARLAAEQGREVFAVPGSIFSHGSEGTHRLIQSGAKLVHAIDDIFDELPLLARPSARPSPAPPPAGLRPTLELLSFDAPAHIDHLLEKTAVSSATLAETLLELELEGWVRALPGSRFVRVR